VNKRLEIIKFIIQEAQDTLRNQATQKFEIRGTGSNIIMKSISVILGGCDLF
jgi:hypothetical protein